jgi:hypothetical protein
LAQGGIVQNHQEAEADKTSFHGSFRSTGITQDSQLGSGQSQHVLRNGSSINEDISALTRMLSILSF